MKTSVAVCTYHGETYLKEQLESILHQTMRPDEIIVSDDASQDGTVAVAEETLKASGIAYRILPGETNVGLQRNYERAIRACSGDIVFTADQDDVWMPDKVAEMCKAFADGKCELAFSDAKVTDGNLKVTSESLWENVGFSAKRRALFRSGMAAEILMQHNIVTGATMAFRRDFALRCFPLPDVCCHDQWFALHAAMDGEITAVEKPLICYRQHAKNTVGVRRSNSFFAKVKHGLSYMREGLAFDQKFGLSVSAVFCERNQGHFTPEQMAFCEKWKAFSADRAKLPDSNVFAGTALILKNSLNGGYAHFHNVTQMLPRAVDFASLFLHRKQAP